MNKDKRCMVLMAVLALLMSGNDLFAQDWPQWRGVNRDGKAGEFAAPAVWPTKLTQKWSVNVGKGDATPALVGGNLYVFARQGTDEALLCLDAATGKENWKSTYPADHVVGGPAVGHPGPRSSPVVADGKVCALGVGGILTCFDAVKGTVLWRKQSINDYQGIPYKNDTSMSPIVVEGRCIVHIGGRTNAAVMAFDLTSGESKWQWNGDGPANSSPVIMTVGGKKQWVTLTSTKVVGLDLATGKLLWSVPFEATQGNNTTPVIDGSTVIYTGQAKGLLAVKIESKGDVYSATPQWTNASFGARFTTPILKDGMVYGFSGHLFCVNAQSGATVWDEAVSLGRSASLVDAGSVLFAGGNRGELLAFKPGSPYTQFALFKLVDTETWAHPIVSGNRIFVKDNETVGMWTIE